MHTLGPINILRDRVRRATQRRWSDQPTPGHHFSVVSKSNQFVVSGWDIFHIEEIALRRN